MADENAAHAADAGNAPAVEPKGGEGGSAPEPKQPANDEVPTRKPWSNRQERAEFFKGQKAKESGGEDDFNFDEIEDESQKKLAKGIVSSMERKFGQRFTELETRHQEERDDFEIAQFLGKAENEAFKKYEAQARKYAKAHPTFPINGIFRSLAYDDALALGAEKGKKADVKAKQNQVGGGRTERTEPKAPDFLKMSKKEFEEYKRQRREAGLPLMPTDDD